MKRNLENTNWQHVSEVLPLRDKLVDLQKIFEEGIKKIESLIENAYKEKEERGQLALLLKQKEELKNRLEKFYAEASGNHEGASFHQLKEDSRYLRNTADMDNSRIDRVQGWIKAVEDLFSKIEEEQGKVFNLNKSKKKQGSQRTSNLSNASSGATLGEILAAKKKNK